MVHTMICETYYLEVHSNKDKVLKSGRPDALIGRPKGPTGTFIDNSMNNQDELRRASPLLNQ